jgi:hypothetical protein
LFDVSIGKRKVGKEMPGESSPSKRESPQRLKVVPVGVEVFSAISCVSL